MARSAAVLAAVLLVSGCAAAENPKGRELVLSLATEQKELGHDAQYELMKDGIVDREDNDAAFRLLRTCMEDGGLRVSDPVISPADGLRYIFEVQANGLAPEAVDEVQQSCQEEFWISVSSAYADTNPHVMAEPLRLAAIACLIEDGYAMSGDERNFAEMAGDAASDDGAQREAAADCVFAAAHELYPELPSLSLTA